MSVPPQDRWYRVNRLTGLRIFALAITAFTILGHAALGFEQSIAQPVAALVTAYGLSVMIEFVDARSKGRPPAYSGGGQKIADFLLAPHISALAIALLLYSNDRIWPIVFAVAVAVCSKAIIRGSVNGRDRHLLNPSNLGISLTLVLFPWVGIAPPYHFTENVTGVLDWIVPGAIIISGSLLNARFANRIPLIAAWLGGFALQALLRAAVAGTPLAAGLVPMTGVAFILFTFYMITDPATTPGGTAGQVAFGLGCALAYAGLMLLHVVFGLFFALTITSGARAVAVYARSWAAATAEPAPVPAPIAAGGQG